MVQKLQPSTNEIKKSQIVLFLLNSKIQNINLYKKSLQVKIRMRRLPYQQKNQSYISRSHRSSKHEQELDQIKFRLELNKFVSTSNEPYLSSRTTKYPFTQKPQQRLTSKRPYTSQRSNSLNEIKKQDNEAYSKRTNLSMNKNYPIMGNHKSHNDFLWVSNVKELGKQQHPIYSRMNESLPSRGKIHRGISLKHDDRLFAKDYSFDSKKGENSIASSVVSSMMPESISKTQKSNHIDLIGRNLRKSLAQKQDEKDNFFEYVMRFSYKTKKGYTPSNPNKINQDSYITFPNINNKTWEHLFGICDGHGPLGHLVSDFVKTSLPECIKKNPVQSLTKAFDNAFDKLIRDSHIDMSFSGSTVIVCYFLQNRLFCCNVGDSRAILGRQKDNKWRAIPLSTDHKPSIPSEAERIRKSKGRIEAYKDEYGDQIGPLRVWLKHDNVPGLAMTRSFGDLVGASVGVSHQPQIKQFLLTQDDKIIIIASDGVFEFLQNLEIIDAMMPFYEKKQIQQASDHLLNMAHRSWNRNSSIVDDISFVLIFMNYNE